VKRLEREIEAFMSWRLDRPCMFFPSARLALYIALRARVPPRRRILMSPLTDDVIFFTLLAAGLVPVIAPVSRDDGNIDPVKVPSGVWESLDAVVTTNLYGLPDRVQDLQARCRRLGIPLIEDAAHAIETTVAGRPVGTFGDAAVFSLSKHVGAGAGGILAFTDERARPELERLRDAVVARADAGDRLARATTHAATQTVIALHLVWPVRWLRRRLGMVERTEHRMPLRASALQRAIHGGGDLEQFDPWIRVDRRDYRVQPSRDQLRRALRRLRALEKDRDRRLEGVARLAALPTAAAGARGGDPQPLFRVPLLVADRPAAMTRLERRLLSIGYIYDPPLDDYAGPRLAEPTAAADVARWWARHVVPIDPLEADRVLGRSRRARSTAAVLSRAPSPPPMATLAPPPLVVTQR
jgi:DegT/DnrJ/EryC1/StrS aminotransferase family